MEDSTTAEPARRLRILFFLWSLNYDRVFECLLGELLERGHEVAIRLERVKSELPLGAGESLEALASRYEGRLAWEVFDRHPTARASVARGIRRALDYLRYLGQAYAGCAALRLRCRRRLSPRIAWCLDRLERWGLVRRLTECVLQGLERALPIPAELLEDVRAARPDVVLVAPLIGIGSPQADVVRAASRWGIPTVLPVASWDNLTNKGLVRDRPTLTIVWNAEQVEEAVGLHGLPRESVVAVGAHAYDHWFAWGPATTREAFAERVGLAPEQRFLLYACSSRFIAQDETVFVREWLQRIRAAGGALAETAVVVRPHPQNAAIWADFEELNGIVVWPRGGEIPTGQRRKDDYYDSLYYSAAVVGVNTSSLVEAAIVGRPVFTVMDERYRLTQQGTLHFSHLIGDAGVLNVATDWDEHLDQLRCALQSPESFDHQIQSFVDRFVRPRGREATSAATAADAVELAALESASTVRRSRAARVVIALLVAGEWLRRVGRRAPGVGYRRETPSDAVAVENAYRASLLRRRSRSAVARRSSSSASASSAASRFRSAFEPMPPRWTAYARRRSRAVVGNRAARGSKSSGRP